MPQASQPSRAVDPAGTACRTAASRSTGVTASTASSERLVVRSEMVTSMSISIG
ncbi:hypothetical protein [Salinispora arenicola]|uniref:hypothetical protein n=1 Tax=Salinispora arenicola TaxID=168697 RepID=UPI0027DCE053|nr:hypothetical protein [Salinispora arenicola]